MRIALGIPVVDHVPGEAVFSHYALCATIGRRGQVVVPSVLNLMPHDKARNLIMTVARENNADYLMFVDSDMVVKPDAFDLLLETLQKNKCVMAAGHAYRRGYPFTPTWFKFKGEELFQVTASQGVHEIDACGLACNLIDLKWIWENLEKPYFFTGKDGDKRIWEDTFFCKKIRDKGGKIFGDARVRCGHLRTRVAVDDSNADRLRQEFMKQVERKEIFLEEPER